MPMPTTSIRLRKSLDISIPPSPRRFHYSVILSSKTDNGLGSNRFLLTALAQSGLEGPVAPSTDAESTAPPPALDCPPAAPDSTLACPHALRRGATIGSPASGGSRGR